MLLGEPECKYLKEDDESMTLAVAIAVPVVIGVMIIAVITTLYFFPKARLWQRLRREKSNMNNTNEMRAINIEKVDSMEINTSAGRFAIQL